MYKYAKMMQMTKLMVFVLTALLFIGQVDAQHNGKAIAPFKIRLTNGDGFTWEQLPKNKPVILIYFSPTCDHCRAFTENMLKRIHQLKNYEIVMIASEAIKDVRLFDDTYKLSLNKNLKVGSEGYTFVVQRYYNIQKFPFVTEYDAKGRQTKILGGAENMEKLAEQL